MDREPIPVAEGADPRAGQRKRKKAPIGLRIEARGRTLYIMGTVRGAGRSRSIRRGTGLPDTPQGRIDAEAVRDRWATEIRLELVHGVKPTTALAVAAAAYLAVPRKRPFNAYDVRVIQEITARFGSWKLNAIPDADWIAFVDQRQAGNLPQTRERYLASVCSFLSWCMKPQRAWLERLPAWERLPPKDRQSTAHERRRVTELRPDLIVLIIENATWHLRGQLAAIWSTGARVSSILYGCRLCDVILAEGREQITYLATKNGRPNTATLHPWSAEQIRVYIQQRGRLEDREGPLFLTDRNLPYEDNGKAWGGQTRRAFHTARRRAIKVLLRTAVRAHRAHRAAIAAGDHRAAAAQLERYVQLRNDARLVVQVTPHWFRHLIATNMLSNRTDIKSVMEQAGWLDPRMALRYAHLVKPAQRAGVLALPIGSAAPEAKKEESA